MTTGSRKDKADRLGRSMMLNAYTCTTVCFSFLCCVPYWRSAVKKVGIVMGSTSDLHVVEKAIAVLQEYGVPLEVRVLSAHRCPEEAREFAASARESGFSVLIAAAGMAAHLAGALAANTTLPVIGIPCRSNALDGMDALLSTVMMPSGIPVATVAIDGAKNAALLAVQILALGDEALAERLEAARREGKEAVLRADRELREKYR